MRPDPDYEAALLRASSSTKEALEPYQSLWVLSHHDQTQFTAEDLQELVGAVQPTSLSLPKCYFTPKTYYREGKAYVRISTGVLTFDFARCEHNAYDVVTYALGVAGVKACLGCYKADIEGTAMTYSPLALMKDIWVWVKGTGWGWEDKTKCRLTAQLLAFLERHEPDTQVRLLIHYQLINNYELVHAAYNLAMEAGGKRGASVGVLLLSVIMGAVIGVAKDAIKVTATRVYSRYLDKHVKAAIQYYKTTEQECVAWFAAVYEQARTKGRDLIDKFWETLRSNKPFAYLDNIARRNALTNALWGHGIGKVAKPSGIQIDIRQDNNGCC
jgi:hypothetical protein